MIKRTEYYEGLKKLARDVRQQYGLRTPRVMRSDLRRIYRTEGISVDLWPHKLKNLRGAYFFDDLGATVMLAKGIPPEPMIFTMAHELKHHYVDRELGVSYCDTTQADTEPIEIGAEIFAAELIFPEQDFVAVLQTMDVEPGRCTAETLVRLKGQTQTTMSYTALAKRAYFLKVASAGSLSRVKWKLLEEQIFGEPVYKRVLRARARRDSRFA
jgi:Zn-dependent peptidase ImmA (M78 family)